MNTETSMPWYKYPFVWFIVSIPAAAVIAGIFLIWLSLDTDDGLVADDYYKQGLAINRNIERDQNATRQGISANLKLDNIEGLVKVYVNKGALKDYPDVLQLNIYNATRDEDDRHIILNHGQYEQYIGYTKQPLPEGIWYFELSTEHWRLSTRTRVSDEIQIQLKSDST